MVNHYELVKELIDYLVFLCHDKDNLSYIDDVDEEFYHTEKLERSLPKYFMNFKLMCEKLNVFLPFSFNVRTQQF